MTKFPPSSLVSTPSKLLLEGECLVTVRLDDATKEADIRRIKGIYGPRLIAFELYSHSLCDAQLLEGLAGQRIMIIPAKEGELPKDGLNIEQLQALQLSVSVFPGEHLMRTINFFTSLGIPLRIDASSEIISRDALLQAVEFYLYNPLLSTPIEPFHTLLEHIASGCGDTLWELNTEDASSFFYVSDEGYVSFSRRWAEKDLVCGMLPDSWEIIASSDLFHRFSELRKGGPLHHHPCLGCTDINLCGGFLKALAQEFSCNAWQKVFGVLREAAAKARQLTNPIGQGLGQRRISLSPELIQLERNGELLLMDGKKIRPLLLTREVEQAKACLKACQSCRTEDELFEVFDDQILFKTFVDHGLVQYRPEREKRQPCHRHVKENGQKAAKKQDLYLLLTQYCNLGCIYCLNGRESYKKEASPRMGDSVAFQAVEGFLKTLDSGGTLTVVFFGGEPMLNWPLAKRVISFCETELRKKYRDKKIKYHFTTNLTLFPRDLLDWVKRHDITFLIDIDGPEAVHNHTRPSRNREKNSYRQTAKNIKKLLCADIKPALRATVTSYNIDCMLETARLHKDLGGNGSAFVPLTPVNSDEHILPKEWFPDPRKFADNLIAILKSNIWSENELFPVNEVAKRIIPGQCQRIVCGAPLGNTPTVDINGDVYPCIYLVGIDRFLAGNICSGNYPNQTLFGRMAFRVNVDNVEQCKNCAYRYICAGGCPVSRYLVEDNPMANAETMQYARGIVCEPTKSVIDYLLWKIAARPVSS